MIQAIAFDLDDTLLDTSGLLVPAASRRACEALIEQGVPCPLEDCLRLRAEMAPHHSHRDIFRLIAERYGVSDQGAASAEAVQRFYNHPLPEKLPLMPGAEEVLAQLEGRYALYLVTSGNPQTQMGKIKATGLLSRFRHCYTVDAFAGGTKREAFEDILARERIPGHALLSLGNRLCQEIRQTKQVGGFTCYFEYGEHVGEKPERPEDHPDWTIHHLHEFIPTCQL